MAGPFVPGDDPGARYLLLLGDDDVTAVFHSGTGLKDERDISYVDEGGRRFAVARIGPYAKGHVVLEEGESDRPSLYAWFEASRDSDAFISARRTGIVLYLDGGGEVRARWRFRNARITEWIGPADKPAQGEVYPLERVGISHEGLERLPDDA